jgi:hypothetical protein
MEVSNGQRGLRTGRGSRGRDLSKGRIKALQSFEMSGATDIASHARRPAP